MVNPQKTLDQFVKAERLVAQGNENISRQREIIARLERENSDIVSTARNALASMEAVQAVYLADRDRLKEVLRAIEGPSRAARDGEVVEAQDKGTTSTKEAEPAAASNEVAPEKPKEVAPGNRSPLSANIR